MRRRAAIGIDDDFPSGDTGIAIRAADDEAPGGIDVELGRAVDPAFRHHLVDEVRDNFLYPLLAHLLAMLG